MEKNSIQSIDLNPIQKAKYIEESFKDYLLSTFKIQSKVYQDQFKEKLSQTELFKGPYITKTLDFYPGQSLNQLIDEGVVHQDFRKLSDTDLDRPLRYHQEIAIRRVKQGSSIILTTGTGSGKTEAFLYPILNYILNESDIEKPGIRALFLFPMNALVNDQIKRIRDILCSYPKIKFGFYTGDTKGEINERGKDIPINELLDRKSIRKNPPHLLFTNYSMLEYLLLRPKDNCLFSGSNGDTFKFIVLDEAHIYKGALGIEISMLMRRVQSVIKNDISFILASATLGEETPEGIRRIQKFGYNLTSKNFSTDDILFSKRRKLDSSLSKYKIEPQYYLEIYNDKTSASLNKYLEIYGVSVENDYYKDLYNLIIHDENLYLINDVLCEPMLFSILIEKMSVFGFDDYSLMAFIELIAKCSYYKIILDFKYHNFISSLSGGYITLGDNPKLFLKSVKTNETLFEIGFCKKCSQMYIMGIKVKGYLRNRGFIDIDDTDENVDDSMQVDYYLLDKDVNINEIEDDCVEKYELCPICGKLSNSESKMDICEHFSTKKEIIYKVLKSKNSTLKNNITSCPCCSGKSNQGGIVRILSENRESATALLIQTFFESLENSQNKPKQILTFSDSRQQASFAVNFAEYNHHRMLRKRIINEILKDCESDFLSYDQAKNKLIELIDRLDLFDSMNELSPSDQADITLLSEIMSIDGSYSGEGLGIYYFDYYIKKDVEFYNDIKNIILESNIDIKVNNLLIDEIIRYFFNYFRNVPAVYYSALDYETREKFFGYRKFENYVSISNPSDTSVAKCIRPLISKNSRMNKIETFYSKIFNTNKATVDSFITKLWDYLIDLNSKLSNPFMKCIDNNYQTYMIFSNNFNLVKHNKTTWYSCSHCNKVTNMNINGICPNCVNTGTLIECDPFDLKNNSDYYRKQYLNKKIEKLVYKEHTAQIGKERGKEYQRLFVNKKINLLSSSTTFEMGINIGSLENVLLRNVPPSSSNYIQRAGRAGRSQDASSFVLTFCGNNSHDFNYFSDPLTIINGKCTTPIIDNCNEKIILRHLIATALSIFFMNDSKAFEGVNEFYFEGGFTRFIEFLKNPTKELIDKTNHILSTVNIELLDGKWIDLAFNNKYFDINYSKDSITETINEYETAMINSKNNNDFEMADKYKKQIALIKGSKDLIEYMAGGSLIPHYGFPTDLVDLKIKENDFTIKNYDLQRDMRLALSEYSPSSEIMVDQNLIVSKYLRKHNDIQQKYFYRCENCNKVIILDTDLPVDSCVHCGINYSKKIEPTRFAIPKYGFIGEAVKKKGNTLKPKKSRLSPLMYVGNGINTGDDIEISNNIHIYCVKNDELLVVNDSMFFVCRECGFSVIADTSNKDKPIVKKKHEGPYDRCNNDTLYKDYTLGYQYKTDVFKIVFDLPIEDVASGISALYALLDGISESFNIERSDIDGIYVFEENKHSFILFDTFSGGAGYVKNLLDKDSLKTAFEYALYKVTQDCCQKACYRCLMNYNNQIYHKILDKEKAAKALRLILSELEK